MKKTKWVDALVILALLLITCAVRIVYVNFYLDEISVSGELLQRAGAAGSNPLALFNFDFDSIYAVLLSLAMGLFGNKAIVGVGLNIVLQIVNLLLIYLCIRIVSDVIAATIPTLIISVIPVYFATIRTISSFQLFNIGITCCLLLLIIFCKIIALLCRSIFGKHIDEEQDDYEDQYYDQNQQYDEYEQQNEQESPFTSYEDESTEPYEDDGNYSEEEPVAYQDEVWNDALGNTVQPFSETELDALSGKGYEQEDNTATLPINEQQASSEQVPEESEKPIDNMSTDIVEGEQIKMQSQQGQTYHDRQAEQVAPMSGTEQNFVQPQFTNYRQPVQNPSYSQPSMNYDVNPRNDYMHYDIEDMTGMDYFDIE